MLTEQLLQIELKANTLQSALNEHYYAEAHIKVKVEIYGVSKSSEIFTTNHVEELNSDEGLLWKFQHENATVISELL